MNKTIGYGVVVPTVAVIVLNLIAAAYIHGCYLIASLVGVVS